VKELLKSAGLQKTRRRISSERRKIVYERDGKRCRYCGKLVDYIDFHLDHVHPRVEWGNDYVFNLVASCPECNLRKGRRTDIVPKPLEKWRQIYGIYLIVKYKDYPKVEDFL
jgi:5-methylcytosine-specific restriction endonuclease McrA